MDTAALALVRVDAQGSHPTKRGDVIRVEARSCPEIAIDAVDAADDRFLVDLHHHAVIADSEVQMLALIQLDRYVRVLYSGPGQCRCRTVYGAAFRWLLRTFVGVPGIPVVGHQATSLSCLGPVRMQARRGWALGIESAPAKPPHARSVQRVERGTYDQRRPTARARAP